MPRFKCISCDTGFFSAADLAELTVKTCSDCGSLVELADDPRAEELVLSDRLGHLIVRREVVRAQVRVHSEQLPELTLHRIGAATATP